MDKKNQLSFKYNHSWDQQGNDREVWSDRDTSNNSPTLPFSHYQKRQRKKSSNRGEGKSPWRTKSSRQTRRGSRMSPRLKSSSKLVFTIGSAIGLGLLMGMMVLNIFSNLNEEPSAKLSSLDEQPGVEKAGEQLTLPQDETPTIVPSGGTEEGNNLHLPARSYYVVQAGAFTEKAMAEEGLSLQQQQGWAGLLLGNAAPYRLYAGLASSKEEAMLLGQYYRERNMDIYVKEHQTEPIASVAVQFSAEELASLPAFISRGELLLEKMGRLSSTGIMNSEKTLEASEWRELQELHRTFLQDGQTLFAAWPEDGKSAGESMLHQLTEGMNALDAYHKQQHSSYLWKVQQALLNYLQAYEQLIETLK